MTAEPREEKDLAAGEETIAAIATPLGEGAIGIVRLSGSRAGIVAARFFYSGKRRQETVTPEWFRSRPSHTLNPGVLVDPATKTVLDEVLLSFMAAPLTYTGEDCVEINCHGGPLLLERVLEVILRQEVRLAHPGEMTRRAFLNGRLDLAQAEAVMDVIRARSDAGLRQAISQLGGQFSAGIRSLRENILGALATIEVSIDFTEDDVPTPHAETLVAPLYDSLSFLNQLLHNAEQGLRTRQGVKAVLVGRPNVGKSSLLNALLGTERAIVTSLAGTTRDTIEETILLGGIALTLIDTAGILESNDLIERSGVKRSREVAEQADLILFVLDGSQPHTRADSELLKALLPLISSRPTLVILNKSDLPKRLNPEVLLAGNKKIATIATSTRTQEGISALQAELTQLLTQDVQLSSETILVTNVRHKNALYVAAEHLQAALATLERHLPLDFVAIDLHGALQALGEITGETVGEALLDRIFHDFCIGK